MNLYKNINNFDYFALFLIKESKNKTMEMQIIVIHDAQDDFDMKPDNTLFIWLIYFDLNFYYFYLNFKKI